MVMVVVVGCNKAILLLLSTLKAQTTKNQTNFLFWLCVQYCLACVSKLLVTMLVQEYRLMYGVCGGGWVGWQGREDAGGVASVWVVVEEEEARFQLLL